MKQVGQDDGRSIVLSVLLASLGFMTVTACGSESSILDPRGPAAERIADLTWIMLALSAVVFVFVVAMIAVSIVRGRRRTEADVRKPVPWGERFIVVAGIVVSVPVLVAVFVLSLRDMVALAERGDQARLEIDVTGHDWWWEATYPNGAVTANEIHIPAGEPVQLNLRTGDVIHSFWVPQLAPKMDMVPGKVNELWVEADEPGRYRGQCAEFCGLQHANMVVFVVADTPDDFQRWMAHEAEPADVEAEGRDVFERSTCAGCHAIRGTSARGNAGPDLTHLDARETIASGILPNNRGNLARWILDPQSVKPGATMPPSELSAREIEALLDYLESLD